MVSTARDRTPVLDHGYVEFVESWGSDERIIEAARMSTDKGFRGWGGAPCPECIRLGRIDEVDGLYRSYELQQAATTFPCGVCKGSGKTPGDEKLLRYLWKHRHHTPFEMAGLTLEIQAPILVFRQWHRHRTQSYNEMSGRYTVLPELYYVPSVVRLLGSAVSTSNRQASGAGELAHPPEFVKQRIELALQEARRYYEELLSYGVSSELARVVTPVAQYSKMRASANLRNWLHFLGLRLDLHAQWETRQFADAVAKYVAACFPRTFGLFAEDVT